MEMQAGLSFSEAYHRVKQKMGSRRIKEIQEETLYAVDTKYRKMKNTMKISGVAGTTLFGFAAIFKIEHFPGASILMTLGALLLAFVFLPSALGVLWKETHNRQRLFLFISAFFAGMFFILGTLLKLQHWPAASVFLFLAVLSGILFFIPALTLSRLKDQENKAKRPLYIIGAAGIIAYSAGMFFKIQHWPVAVILLVSGMILLCVIAFPLYTWHTWKEDNNINARFLFLLIGLLLIVVPGTLINLNLQGNYNEGFYSHPEQQHALYNYKYTHNQSLINKYRDSSCYRLMEDLHSKTTRLLGLVGVIQTKMVEEAEGKPGMPAVSKGQITQTEIGPEIHYKLLLKPFNAAPARDFLQPGTTSRQDLNSALKEYSDYITGLFSGVDLQKYNALMEPSIYLPGTNQNGTQISLLSGLHSLELLKNSILTVELYMLSSVAKN
jgi:uncharacterized membrane protein